jgi:hypothetical protein
MLAHGCPVEQGSFHIHTALRRQRYEPERTESSLCWTESVEDYGGEAEVTSQCSGDRPGESVGRRHCAIAWFAVVATAIGFRNMARRDTITTSSWISASARCRSPGTVQHRVEVALQRALGLAQCRLEQVRRSRERHRGEPGNDVHADPSDDGERSAIFSRPVKRRSTRITLKWSIFHGLQLIGERLHGESNRQSRWVA